MSNPMSKQAADALELSIVHWQENVEAETPEAVRISGAACALCIKFYGDGDCDNCPVKAKTGEDRCFGSPYYNARNALDKWQFDRTQVNAALWRTAAQAELDFLISLREPTKAIRPEPWMGKTHSLDLGGSNL